MADALHTPGVTSAAEARLDDAGLIAIQGPTALDARTGVMVGPGTTALITGTADTSPMSYLVAPHHWVTNRGVNTDGVYRGTLEAATRVTTTAAPGSGSRIDVIYEKQGDANSTITPDGSTAPVYAVAQGTSTTGTPTAPSIPVGAIEVGRATVSAGATATNGSGVVITQTARQTTTRGGTVPVATQAERLTLATYPSLRALELDKHRALYFDGSQWRYEGDFVPVANQAERLALNPIYDGLRVKEADTDCVWLYDGSTWFPYDTKWQTYTPAWTVNGVAVTVGNGTLVGRYFRVGRLISIEGYLALGSTTSYNGGNGLIEVTYPTGLVAAAPITNVHTFGGPARMSGTTFSTGFCLNEYKATPSQRRMWFADTSDHISGSSGAGVLVNASGHWISWQNNYETAFEA